MGFKSNYKVKLLLSLIAGGITPLAFAPFGYSLLVFLTIAILFAVWLNCTTNKQAFWSGYAFGFGLFGIGVNWLHISINLFGGVNSLGAYFLTYTLVAFLALYPALVGYLGRRFFKQPHGIYLILVLPALWTVLEWCRSWVLTGFPWLNLGYTQTDSVLAGLAPLFGVYGISWLVCLISALLIILITGKPLLRISSVIAIGLIWLVCYQIQSIPWTDAKDRQLHVALVQGAVPQAIKWRPEQRQKTIELYLHLSKPYWGYDLILWPETAIPMFYFQARELTEHLASLSKAHNTDVIIGFPYKEAGVKSYYNSLIVIGDEQNIYHKKHLVPFGEYLPLDAVLRPFLHFLKIPMSDFSSGTTEKPLLRAMDESIGASICYEDAFGEEVIQALPEASVLINVSNDAWFGDSLAPHQHLQIARMRSMETGRYLLRATNTGVSAVIDEKGNIVAQSPQFKPHALSATITPFQGETPYAKAGNSVIIVAMLLLLGLAILITRRMKDNDERDQVS